MRKDVEIKGGDGPRRERKGEQGRHEQLEEWGGETEHHGQAEARQKWTCEQRPHAFFLKLLSTDMSRAREGSGRSGSGEHSAGVIRLPWYAKKKSRVVRISDSNLRQYVLNLINVSWRAPRSLRAFLPL